MPIKPKFVKMCPRCGEFSFDSIKKGDLCQACQRETGTTWKAGSSRAGSTSKASRRGQTAKFYKHYRK